MLQYFTSFCPKQLTLVVPRALAGGSQALRDSLRWASSQRARVRSYQRCDIALAEVAWADVDLISAGAGVVSVYELARKSGTTSVPATTTTSATTLARSGADASAPPLAPAASIDRVSGVKCGTFGASAAGVAHLATGDLGGALHIMCVGAGGWRCGFSARNWQEGRWPTLATRHAPVSAAAHSATATLEDPTPSLSSAR